MRFAKNGKRLDTWGEDSSSSQMRGGGFFLRLLPGVKRFQTDLDASSPPAPDTELPTSTIASGAPAEDGDAVAGEANGYG